ncbi:MAG: DsbA family protein [Acidobacteriota bacterium]|nr:DsbA family protein [Acidobacteriota bacterium]
MRRLLTAVLLASGIVFAAGRLIEGDPNSAVRVIIYEDLQCPDCADFRKMLDTQLLPRYATKVAFEHRDFPLAKHAWARRAAVAARYFEEAKPGLGLAWRKYAMANLRQITADTFSGRLAAFAKENAADPAQAVAALDDPRLAALVEKDFQDGIARGIAKTPTVLVNGQPFIETFTFEEIARAIDSELAR